VSPVFAKNNELTGLVLPSKHRNLLKQSAAKSTCT
jgi:hypothetical protein